MSALWIDWRWQSEIDPFPNAVLAHRFPDAVNLGDMTKFKEWPDADVDVLAGGTPCQSFSVAGLRKGLADPRGNLALTYLAIAARYRPRWLVWENVPGLLSSSAGRDFGSFLGALGKLGYGWSYRVLDAQYVRTSGFPWAAPQRRRRVFVVGYFGDWRPAAAVLLEPEGMQGNPPPRREAREVAPTIPARRTGGGGLGTDFDCDGGLIPPVANPLTARMHKGINTTLDEGQTPIPSVTHSLRGEGFDASEDGTGRGTPIVPVCFDCKGTQVQTDTNGTAPTLRAMGSSKSHANAGGQLAVALQQSLQRVFLKGVNRLIEKEYTNAHAAQAGPGEALRALRRAYGEKAFQKWCSGIAFALRPPEILRSDLHGDGIRRAPVENAGMVNDPLPRTEGSAERALPEMRGAECAGRSSYRPRPHEQQTDEPDADMPKLSQQGASAEAIMRHMRGSDEGARLLQQASDTLEKVWRPDGDENSASEEMHRMRCASALEVALREALHAGQASGNTSSLTDQGGIAPEEGGFGVYAVRRLTPRLRECERLQGFPDDWTKIPYRNKPAEKCPDGPRYKALGNSWALNCGQFVFDRIRAVEAILQEAE